jgi:outer membrane protein assembly factor BamB
MKRNTLLNLALIVVSLAIILVAGAGCASTSIAAQGWPGVASANGRLFYMALSAAGGGGFLGCGASPPSSQLIILNSSDGGILTTLDLGDSTISYGTPVANGDFAYITGYNGKVYKFNVVSGGNPLGVYLDADNPESIIGGVVVADSRVFVASVDGYLYALNQDTLARLWRFKTGDKIWSTPVVANGTVYIGSFDKKVYALDAASGAEKWSFDTGGAVVAAPVVSGNSVFIASLGRNLFALDANTGDVLWQYPSESSLVKPGNWFWATPVLEGGFLYAPNTDGNIYIINAQDGTLQSGPLKTGDSIVSSPVLANGNVILVTVSGNVYTIGTGTKEFNGSAYDLRTTGSANSGIVVRASLLSSDGFIYIHTNNPEKVYKFDPSAKTVTEVGTGPSSTTAPPPSSVATVTVTVTTTA